ncbi:hypothetical protein [uncultured Roseobacter sp.]|uniref:hypothetical protein n=1 Tax=uncultured Roseobacter sp. TaxID=114847 RepID=UPI00261B4109|nr:hypothetical protein [uncultured Roseobacter sp.]
MSNPVTNSQVEDVLSSIRRLVSDNKRGNTPQADESQRLVLSPQQRVGSAVSDEPAPQLNTTSDRTVLTLMPEDAIRQTPQDDADLPVPEFIRHNNGAAQSDSRRATSSLADKIAALETAIAGRSEQWEPDGDGRDAYAGTRAPSVSLQSTVDLDGTGAPLADSGMPMTPVASVGDETHAPAGAAPAQSRAQGEEQVLDEAALTALVSEIVRRELQGDLGERITRNVRKLVRREIMQALATRDLD